MRRLNLLKVAEGRIAFDVVLLLKAVKLSWVNIHPRQYLKNKSEKMKEKRDVSCQGGDDK